MPWTTGGASRKQAHGHTSGERCGVRWKRAMDVVFTYIAHRAFPRTKQRRSERLLIAARMGTNDLESGVNTYEFTLILTAPEESEDDVEALYSQFNDGTIITSNRVTRIEFDREAESLRVAILSAIADVERAGFHVARVESELAETINTINADLAASH